MLRRSFLCAVSQKLIWSAQRSASSLICTKGLIDGSWVSAISGNTFDVKNPANGNVIASVPNMNENDAQLAITAARKAFYSDEWSLLTAKQRSQLLKVVNLLLKYNNNV